MEIGRGLRCQTKSERFEWNWHSRGKLCMQQNWRAVGMAWSERKSMERMQPCIFTYIVCCSRRPRANWNEIICAIFGESSTGVANLEMSFELLSFAPLNFGLLIKPICMAGMQVGSYRLDIAAVCAATWPYKPITSFHTLSPLPPSPWTMPTSIRASLNAIK